MNQFYKGRTNNHLTWVMVDATDFATPESAVSAATAIKIYGKVRGATGVNFVSSGAGSLTNDIQHVGASATGIYTIALAKADLSDASNAWYDQYIVTLSATGCARQTLVIDGGIDDSEILSQLLITLSAASDAASAAAQGNSRVLLVQSRLSDFNSVYTSDISDIRSMLTALSDAISDAHSDLGSKIAGITATVGASDISDIASAVWANTIGARVDSRVLVIQSLASDAHSAAILAASNASEAQSHATLAASRILLVQSRLSDFNSAFQSDLSDLRSYLSDIHSDLKSAVGGITVSLDASNISDIASAVVAALPITSMVSDIYSAVIVVQSMASDAASAAQQANSRILVVQSLASDAHSAAILGASHASDAHSAATLAASRALLVQSRLSDLDSRLASDVSDVLSQLLVVQSMASDAHSAATVAGSRALLVQSRLSDLDSRLVSDLSDIASNVAATKTSADAAASRALLNQSRISDVYSLLSDLHSDVAVVSGVLSDAYSLLTAGVEVGASSLSDLRSAITANGLLAAGAEPTTVIGHTDSLKAKIDWLTALSRNKITQTSTLQSLRNDADNSTIASATVSDDATTFTRGKFAS